MADNTTLNTGTGGDVIASDDITGVKFQRVKITLGADGVNDGDVSSSNALPVSMTTLPSGTNNIGDVDVLTLPALPAGSNYIGKVRLTDGTNDVTVDTSHADASSNTDNHYDVGAYLMGFNGTTWDRLRSDTTNGVDVDVVRLPALPAGSNSIGILGANSGVDIGDVTINNSTGASAVNIQDGGNSLTVDAPLATPVNVQVGNGTLAAGVIDETGVSAVDALAVGGGTAHDAVDSGNPVKVGGVAVSGSATPTSVASGDRTRFIANQHGIPYNIGGHPNLITREYDFGTAAQTDVNLAAALVAADERIYVTRCEVFCDNANTVAVSARVGFGTANVPSASATGVSGMIASHPGIAPGSGIICGNGSGIIAVGGAGEEPRITTSAATSGNTHVIFSYFLIDETP